jgi:hypothetical protein
MLSFGPRSLCVSLIFVAAFLVFSFRSYMYSAISPKGDILTTERVSPYQSTHAIVESWKITTSTRVVALIFYGRREFVSILDCYLQVYITSSRDRKTTDNRLAESRS